MTGYVAKCEECGQIGKHRLSCRIGAVEAMTDASIRRIASSSLACVRECRAIPSKCTWPRCACPAVHKIA